MKRNVCIILCLYSFVLSVVGLYNSYAYEKGELAGFERGVKHATDVCNSGNIIEGPVDFTGDLENGNFIIILRPTAIHVLAGGQPVHVSNTNIKMFE
jgi:hypothetical protein